MKGVDEHETRQARKQVEHETRQARKQVEGPKSQQFLAVGKMLYELARHSELGVLELARRTGVSVGTAQRIVASLLEMELLACSPDTHKYSLGRGVLRLRQPLIENTAQPLQRLLPELERLSRLSGETTAIHRIAGIYRVIVAQVVGRRDLTWRADTASLHPLHAGAASKALLAFMPSPDLDALFDGYVFTRYLSITPSNRAELDVGLEEVRRCGYAVSFGERVIGSGGVAIPVFNAAGRVEYSLSIYGPEQRVRPALPELIELLREAVGRICSGGPPSLHEVSPPFCSSAKPSGSRAIEPTDPSPL